MRYLTALVLTLTVLGCQEKSTPPEPTSFRIALLADTHIIDDYYVGPENGPLDTESILHSVERLQKTQKIVNRIQPAVEQVFVAGDVIHDYGSTERAFYDSHRTVFDIAGELFRGFSAPVHIGFGNHDYDPKIIPRAMTEELFKTKLGVPAPYYAVDHKGWRFLHLNCFQGYTWDPENPKFDSESDYGSFGRTQLEWMESQLAEGKPTVLIFHIPLPFLKKDELPDLDFFRVLNRHTANVKMIVAGHWHLWFDLGETSGAPHMVVASTRYDENSFAIAELTTDTHQFRFVNSRLWHMMEHETDPWPAAELQPQ
jgi:hypothetical protein